MSILQREMLAVNSVSIIGAGLMGRSIAAANLERGIAVLLSDSSEEVLSRSLQAITEEVRPPSGMLRAGRSDRELATSPIVIETVVERPNVKRRVLSRLEPYLGRDTILTSNTSSIPINRIAGSLKSPGRFAGLHFCHPVDERPLVEVVPGEKTSERTLATVIEYVTFLGKRPLLVKDSPGFVVNRLLWPYLNEGMELLLAGQPVESIDAAARAFGMPMGPLTRLDEMGIDVSIQAGQSMQSMFPGRRAGRELLADMFAAGLWGRKSHAGFYNYSNGVGNDSPNPAIASLIASRRETSARLTVEQIQDRLILPMLVEAVRVLDEGLVGSAADVDRAVTEGLGFPRSTGGLLAWAGRVGLRIVVEKLKQLAHLGIQFQPPQSLLDFAQDVRR